MADNIHAAFERDVAILDKLDDPLNVFERYYQQLLQTQSSMSAHPESTPAGQPSLTRLLERATQAFVDDRRYRNDPRYLRLWLDYARRCREPEDIYAFLAMRGIAAELAGYYEEYAAYLEGRGDPKALLTLSMGVERGAQPLERLRQRLTEYQQRHPSTRPVRQEIHAYKDDLLQGGRLSFEEARARGWRRAGSILKASYVPPPTETTNAGLVGTTDDHDGDLDVDPDDLTHISIYKDNTADMRELARSLAVSKENTKTSGRMFDNQIPSVSLERPPASLTATPDILDEFMTAPVRVTIPSIPGESSELTQLLLPPLKSRLSLIPEESDVATCVSGVIPFLLDKSRGRLRWEELFRASRSRHSLPSGSDPSISRSSESISDRLAALNQSIGRDGQGHNQTVASLRLPTGGHYFVEKRLGEHALLAVDLDADLTNSIELHQLVLKITDSPWESIVLSRAAGISAIPAVGRVSEHPREGNVITADNSLVLYTRTYYPHGTFASMGANVDEKLSLFWIRELVITLTHLHSRGILHGALTRGHLMVRLGPQLLASANFDPTGGGGWSERGVALIGWGSRSLILERNGSERDCDTIILDPPTVTAASVIVQHSAPMPACLVDLSGLLGVLSELLPPRGQRRYETLWERLEQIIGGLFNRPLSETVCWDDVIPIYASLKGLLDDALIIEAPRLPTLKSLLTKLEISLLERPRQ